MPEYLGPGVYVEEVSFRSRSIEGVPTDTTGFVGAARFGPVSHEGGPRVTGPRLVTSVAEFERVYGTVGDLQVVGGRPCYLAHAVRAFFLNGGRRLYVQRVFRPESATSAGVASATFAMPVGGTVTTGRWSARWPGSLGNASVTVTADRGPDVAVVVDGRVQADGARQGALVEVVPSGSQSPAGAAVDAARLRVVHVDDQGVQSFHDVTGAEVTPDGTDHVALVELRVVVGADGRLDETAGLSTHPSSPRYIGAVLGRDDPEDEDAVVCLDLAMPTDAALVDEAAIRLAEALVATAGPTQGLRLTGGNDGAAVTSVEIAGRDPGPEDPATGLAALAEVDDIAVVAAPDVVAIEDEDDRDLATDALISHAERCRYRFAIVDGPRDATVNGIRRFRGRLDSSYAALYHPWVEVAGPAASLLVPPSGVVAGVYARTDVERGVHKAPANELLRGVTGLETPIGRAEQDVLNPEGINVLRSFPGRGTRVWGARTLSSDPEWRYVNVRRLVLFLEHSIDKGTQWAVFEPNDEALWGSVARTVSDFLHVQWRNGALLGAKPEEGYFVRCDRTTMTQNDLDAGRLVCMVGVAPVRPAEFVVFRVAQPTAGAR